ncbi:DUF3027 domain-containing protein [Pseudonocardiaceae bacterium YIM PH 21723]|nr:DUF3027 domain-containing protein [Pseudonocardiaceae bacterium YIM PH 21723]
MVDVRHNKTVTPTPTIEEPRDAGTQPAEFASTSTPDQRVHPALNAAVDLARAAAAQEAGDEPVGEYVAVHAEGPHAATHLFEAGKPGYGGWRWAVTVAVVDDQYPVTVSEVVLLPGPQALVAPTWLPWQDRIQAGDLGVGDLMPTAPDDGRLAPGYLQSEDEAVEEVAMELGFGRVRVLSRNGRLDAAERWETSDFGPRSDMARFAPAKCGSCGFYLPLAGSMRAAFGACANEIGPADGRIVHTEYGCGAHSEVEVEVAPLVPVADLVYDDALLDVEANVKSKDDATPDASAAAQTEPAETEQA